MLSWQRPSTTRPEFAVLNAQESAYSPSRNKEHRPGIVAPSCSCKGLGMRYPAYCALAAAIFGVLAQPASAQDSPQPGRSGASVKNSRIARPAPDDLNAWTVGLAGGLLEGTFIRYAADLAKVLDDGDNLRVIPMVTFGAVGNVTDLLKLRGVDVAITQADVLDHFRREGKVPDIDNRIQYISPLFHAEVHIYAREEFKNL